jgi:hypothetical protein
MDLQVTLAVTSILIYGKYSCYFRDNIFPIRVTMEIKYSQFSNSSSHGIRFVTSGKSLIERTQITDNKDVGIRYTNSQTNSAYVPGLEVNCKLHAMTDDISLYYRLGIAISATTVEGFKSIMTTTHKIPPS